MRRTAFIGLWTVGLTTAMLVVGIIGFALLGFAGVPSWNQSTVVLIGRCWSVAFFGVPVVGFVLGVVGKLPGTRRTKPETCHAA